MNKAKQLIALGIAGLAVAGCDPDPGPGGLAEIRGTTAHHAVPIPSTRVFIKWGATSSPGTDPAAYDDSTTSGADGRFVFGELERGAYYLYGIGYDSSITAVVTAGIPVVISEKKEVEDVILPVTE